MLIPSSVPWTRQPSTAWALSAAAVQFGVLPGLLPWSDRRIVGSAATIVPTVAGLAHRSAAAATGAVRHVIPPIGNADGQYIGLLTVFRTTTTAANSIIGALGSESGGTGTTLHNLYLTGAGTANVTYALGNDFGVKTPSITGVNANNGRINCVLAISGPGETADTRWAIYVNGTRSNQGVMGSAKIGTGHAYTSVLTGAYRRGGVDSIYSSPQGDVDTLAVFPILRTSMPGAGEAMQITANPWQLFAPIERRIWVPQAGITGAPTLSDLRAINVGATSTQWSIDYTFA